MSFCAYCDGDGWVRVQTDAIRTGSMTCPVCNGTGEETGEPESVQEED